MIDVINLKKSFNGIEVLKGIDITINKGDIVVVIGPSGSGKSTFLRCLNLMETPSDGKVLFKGEDITEANADINMYRRHIGMVFQHFNLFNNMTVIENIMLAPVYTMCKEMKKSGSKAQIKEDARQNAMKLLKRIGLADKADVYPSTLSGGQKQRVAIVR